MAGGNGMRPDTESNFATLHAVLDNNLERASFINTFKRADIQTRDPLVKSGMPISERAARLLAIREGLKARGILTAGGLGKFETTGFRIGHMGDIRVPDVEQTLIALEAVLHELSVRVE